MGTEAPTSNPESTSLEFRLSILMEEYRALYELVRFRMTSLDKRVPIAGSAVAVFLGSVIALPADARLMVLVTVPAILVWTMRSTINHARSFEDAVRRIDEIERMINSQIGEELLVFQSSHPSRGRQTGGRTGFETIVSVFLMSLILLGVSGCLFLRYGPGSFKMHVWFACYLSLTIIYLMFSIRNLKRYRYRKSSSENMQEGNASNI